MNLETLQTPANDLFAAGKSVQLQNLRQKLQEVVHSVHAPSHPLGHKTISLSVLRQTIPSEIRHEETHFHSHR